MLCPSSGNMIMCGLLMLALAKFFFFFFVEFVVMWDFYKMFVYGGGVFFLDKKNSNLTIFCLLLL